VHREQNPKIKKAFFVRECESIALIFQKADISILQDRTEARGISNLQFAQEVSF
jgi:hypothetical protein